MSQSITTSFSAYWRSNVIPLNTLFYTPSSYLSELFQELLEGDLSSTTATTTATATSAGTHINMQPPLPPSQSIHLSRLYMVSLLDKQNMDIYQNHNLSHQHDVEVVNEFEASHTHHSAFGSVQPNDYSQHSPSTKTRGSNHCDNIGNDPITASTNNVSTSNHNNNNRSSNNHATNSSKQQPTTIQHYQSNMEFYTCARSLWEDQQSNTHTTPHVTNPSLPPPTVEMGNNPLGGPLKPFPPSYHGTTTPSTTPTPPQPPELKFSLFSSFLDQLLMTPPQLNHNIAFNRYVSETPYSSHTSITTQFTLFDENFVHPENQRDLDPLSYNGIQQQQQIARQGEPLYFHSFITTSKWTMHHAIINPHHSPYQCVITPIHAQRYLTLIQLIYDTKMHHSAQQDTTHHRTRSPAAVGNSHNRHDKQNFIGFDTISMFFFFLALYNAKTLSPTTHTVSTAAHHSPTLSAASVTTPTGPFSTEMLKLVTIKYLQHSKSTDFLKIAQHVNKLRYDRFAILIHIPQPIFPSYQRYCELSLQLLTTVDENVATNPHFTSRQKAHTISAILHNHLHILCYDACDVEQVEKMKVIIEQIYVEAQYKLQQTQKLLSQGDQNNANHNTNPTPANHDKVALLDTLFLNNYNYNNNTTNIHQEHGDPRDPIIIVFELYYQQTAPCHNINNTQSQMLTNYHMVQGVNDKWGEVRNLLNVEIQHVPINKALYYNAQQQKLAMYPLNNTSNKAPLLLKQKINREFLTLLYAFVALHVSELMAQSKWTLGGEAPLYFQPKKQERSCTIQ